MTDEPGYYIAPFDMGGDLVGIEFWPIRRLSHEWLQRCGRFLEGDQQSIDAKWEDGLSHIRTKLTRASGTAIVAFYCNERIASSVFLATGLNELVEREVMQMFVESLRRTIPVTLASETPKPFDALFTIGKRPLMVVVPWPESLISEEDHELVRELGLHLAGAFLVPNQGQH